MESNANTQNAFRERRRQVIMLPTLKGVFPEPKSQPKRNFVRENKMHLKDLQRSSSRQQQLKAEEIQKLSEMHRQQRQKSLDRQSVASQRRPISGNSYDCRSIVSNTSRGSKRPPASEKCATSSREVQTDDIVDEEFLYQALKRCSSVDIHRDGIQSARHENPDRYSPPTNTPVSEMAHQNGLDDDNVRNLDIGNLNLGNEPLPQTARSSTQLSSRRTGRRQYELGGQEGVRLPKYLEREKREKQHQIKQELQKDDNCPPGYAPVPEIERKSTLDTAQKQFQDLVDELNRMPMTTQTLRMRNRKAEIERLLTQLEAEIRIFSKPKVYVKTECLC